MKRHYLILASLVLAVVFTAAASCRAGVGASAAIPETPYNTVNKTADKNRIDLPEENSTSEQDMEGLEVRHPLNTTQDTWHEMNKSQKDE